MRPEVDILQKLQQQRQDHPEELPLIDLPAKDTANLVPDWIATSTMPICCELASLENCPGELLSEEFTWLVYSQAHQALEFLHKCGIAHGDIHVGNVMVGYSRLNDNRLPQVKLIDFGMSQQYSIGSKNMPSMDQFDSDIHGLMCMLVTMLEDALIKCALCVWGIQPQFSPHCTTKVCSLAKAIDHEMGRYSGVTLGSWRSCGQTMAHMRVRGSNCAPRSLDRRLEMSSSGKQRLSAKS